MRDVAVHAIREEEQIALGRVEQIGGAGLALLRLLPRIATQLDAVQPEHRLHQPRAVGAPRCHAAPEVAGALEIVQRTAGDRPLLGGKARVPRLRLHGLAVDQRLVDRQQGAERHGAARASGGAGHAAERDAVPARLGLRRREVAAVQPTLVFVRSAHAVPVVALLEQRHLAAGDELRDLRAGDAGLGEHRRHRGAHDGARGRVRHALRMSPGARVRTARSIASSSARTASVSTWAGGAAMPRSSGAVAKTTSPSKAVATGVMRR